jgi:hypothetical protein
MGQLSLIGKAVHVYAHEHVDVNVHERTRVMRNIVGRLSCHTPDPRDFVDVDVLVVVDADVDGF